MRKTYQQWTAIRVTVPTRELIRQIAAFQERDMETVVKLLALRELERHGLTPSAAIPQPADAQQGAN